MKILLRIITIVLCVISYNTCDAQNNSNQQVFNAFRNAIHSDFESFRREAMNDFIEFLRNPWKDFESNPPIETPEETPVPPIILPDDDKAVLPPIDAAPIVIDKVIKPLPIIPQPQPISPIEEAPVETSKKIKFYLFGTECMVRCPMNSTFHLRSIKENDVADALESLSSDVYDNLIYDCLQIRAELKLCDWAYLMMLKSMSETVCQSSSNEAVLLLAYIYMQSGYKMRLAHDNEKLYMLFASHHAIFGRPSYTIDGFDYYGIENLPVHLFVSNVSFPKEQSLSLIIDKQPQFTTDYSSTRTVAAAKYNASEVSAEVNRNLMDFYSTYPSSYYNGNFMTQWSLYANTPIADNIKEKFYPQVETKIKGLSEYEAVSFILNLIQTGFKYEYDDKIWGHDRTFFSEETLYYPYCDCEDRSILFTRLVRDLVGLKCALIYYPGHLAAAVNFSMEVMGDYFVDNGSRYVVCDPTYIGAPVGRSMPDMDKEKANIILLK